MESTYSSGVLVSPLSDIAVNQDKWCNLSPKCSDRGNYLSTGYSWGYKSYKYRKEITY